MADRISPSQVAHVAKLARLVLSPGEIEVFAGQLGAILDHAADVASLDLTKVPPTAHPMPLANVLRADEATPGVDREELLAAAPVVESDRFAVPRIMGEVL